MVPTPGVPPGGDGDEQALWYAALGQLVDEVVMVHRDDRTIAFVSPSVEAVLGYTVEEFTEYSTLDLIHPDDLAELAETAEWIRSEPGRSYRSVLRIRRADGSWTWVEVVGRNLLQDPAVRGVLNTIRDVSERRALEDRLLHQATHDDLTGLANRAHMTERIGSALDGDPPGSVALLFMDLDGFKLVNDEHGHDAGDELLRVVARRLRGVVRGDDLAGRIGGDEFLALCRGVDDGPSARRIAERIHESVRGTAAIAGTDVVVRLSVGVARAGAGSTVDVLMRTADAALYEAKGAGGDQISFGPTAGAPR